MVDTVPAHQTIGEGDGIRAGFGNYPVTVVPHFPLTLSDGTTLGVKFWFPARSTAGTCFQCHRSYRVYDPKEAESPKPQPAILEYLPYRKSDWTAPRDFRRHTWFCSHGYVVVRCDMRGSGDSEGLYFDEYVAQEQKDAAEVICWLSEQGWCTGRVGMYGKSWGGANGLQMAALQPPALKTSICLYFMDDRYDTDVHYQGGCLLGSEMLSWASRMFAYNALPPDPRHVPNWRQLWKSRLEGASMPWVTSWIAHQTRDAFWKHSSVCEDPARVNIPILAIGGWKDGYKDPVFRVVQSLSKVRGIIGPWSHEWPDIATPGPQIDYLDRCLAWWDCHLKCQENGAMDAPLLRAYVQKGAPPAANRVTHPGHWIQETGWPPAGEDRKMTMIPDNSNQSLKVQHSTTCDVMRVVADSNWCAASGMWTHEWLSFGAPDGAADQRMEDALSLSWQTAVLEEDIVILGSPVLTCTVSANHDSAILAARLCDVHPDGQTSLITYGLLNLTHRVGHGPDDVRHLIPGHEVKVTLTFVSTSWTVAQGHRLRLAVSPQYWPMTWPSKKPVSLSVATGCEKEEALTSLVLPICNGKETPLQDTFDTPRLGPPLITHYERQPEYKRHNEYGLSDGLHALVVKEDDGRYSIPHEDGTHTVVDNVCVKRYSIKEGDPLSACANVQYNLKMLWPAVNQGDDIEVHIETESVLWADHERFHMENKLKVSENGTSMYSMAWHDDEKRQFV